MERLPFLQVAAGGGATAAGAGAALSLWPKAQAGPHEKLKVFTFCELCFWKCGVVATVENGEVTKPGQCHGIQSKMAGPAR